MDFQKPTSILQPLPQSRRRFVFLSLLTLFICAVPIFVFYATGYRYDIFSPMGSITATGGLYISVLSEDGELFLNEVPVSDVRIFRNASYLQNLTPGIQRVHVQSPGLHTWVKELPVYAHIVTEAEAFLLPVVPQVRLITEYVTATGTPVLMVLPTEATTTVIFASPTLKLIATTSMATSTYVKNNEFDYVEQLFGTSTESEATLLGRVVGEVSGAFQFASPNDPIATTTATSTTTTTQLRNNIELFVRGTELFVRFVGNERDIPYYFCVPRATIASTTELYGAQVMHGVAAAMATNTLLYNTTETLTETTARICRDEIRIDTQSKNVLQFDFFPGSSDLIIAHLEDGVYVVEVDDRSWQNTQKIYPASAEKMMIDNGRIYIKDEHVYLELLSIIPAL